MFQSAQPALRISLLAILVLPLAALSSDANLPERIFRAVDGSPLPIQTDEEVEEYLRTAEVISEKEIGTYRLSRLSGTEMIPPGVERQVGDDVGVVRLWIEDLESYEEWIEAGNTGTPDSLYLRRELKDQIAFDLLIRNTDRNQGNIN